MPQTRLPTRAWHDSKMFRARLWYYPNMVHTTRVYQSTWFYFMFYFYCLSEHTAWQLSLINLNLLFSLSRVGEWLFVSGWWFQARHPNLTRRAEPQLCLLCDQARTPNGKRFALTEALATDSRRTRTQIMFGEIKCRLPVVSDRVSIETHSTTQLQTWTSFR